MLQKWLRRLIDQDVDLITEQQVRTVACPRPLELTLLSWGITGDSFSLVGSLLYFELDPSTVESQD